MKRKLFYAIAITFSCMFFACGNPENNGTERMDDMEEPIDGVDPLDTMRRDSTDTLGQPMPTPPID